MSQPECRIVDWRESDPVAGQECAVGDTRFVSLGDLVQKTALIGLAL